MLKALLIVLPGENQLFPTYNTQELYCICIQIIRTHNSAVQHTMKTSHTLNSWPLLKIGEICANFIFYLSWIEFGIHPWCTPLLSQPIVSLFQTNSRPSPHLHSCARQPGWNVWASWNCQLWCPRPRCNWKDLPYKGSHLETGEQLKGFWGKRGFASRATNPTDALASPKFVTCNIF